LSIVIDATVVRPQYVQLAQSIEKVEHKCDQKDQKLVQTAPKFGLPLLLFCILGSNYDEVLVGVKHVFFVFDSGKLVYLVAIVYGIPSFLAFRSI